MAENSQLSKAPANYSKITKYGAWIVLAVALTGAAQFDTTAQLAAAFAYLILVASTLWYGPAAIAAVNSLLGNKASSTTIVNTLNGGGSNNTRKAI